MPKSWERMDGKVLCYPCTVKYKNHKLTFFEK
jgi:hypothetical protein